MDLCGNSQLLPRYRLQGGASITNAAMRQQPCPGHSDAPSQSLLWNAMCTCRLQDPGIVSTRLDMFSTQCSPNPSPGLNWVKLALGLNRLSRTNAYQGLPVAKAVLWTQSIHHSDCPAVALHLVTSYFFPILVNGNLVKKLAVSEITQLVISIF